MSSKTKIIMDGVLDGLTWLIIFGAVLLAMATQALKAAGIKPPLSAREIIIRSLGAGLSALTIGLLLMGTGKITLHWALFLGAGGLVGYWGQEVLGFAINAAMAVLRQQMGGAASNWPTSQPQTPAWPPDPPPTWPTTPADAARPPGWPADPTAPDGLGPAADAPESPADSPYPEVPRERQ